MVSYIEASLVLNRGGAFFIRKLLISEMNKMIIYI